MPPVLYIAVATLALLLAARTRLVSARASIVLVLLPLAFTGRALLTGSVYAPIDLAYGSEPLASIAESVGITHVFNPALSDVTAQFIPWNAALRWSIAHRQWPLWNPFELCGNVLAAAAQSAPYHPVTLLSLLLPQADGLTFVATMTYFLAALSAFLFLRSLGMSELAALFGAAGWCYSQHLVAFMLTAHGAAIAVVPLVMFGAQRIIDDPQPRRCWPLLIALTLATLAGHPETLLHIAAVTVTYVLVMARDRLRTVLLVGATGIVTILLCAFFLAPMLEAIPQTREYQQRASSGAAHINRWPVVLHLLRGDVMPFAEGVPGIEVPKHPIARRHSWAGTAYAGALLFPPAMFATVRRRSRLTWFFAALAAVAILAGAEAPVVSTLLAHIPLFSIALNVRLIAFAAFGLCVLAAMGMDADPFLYPLAAIVIVAIAATIRSGLSADFLRISTAREVIPLLLAFICLRLLPARASSVALIGLLLVQRLVEAGAFVPTIDRRAFFPPFGGLAFLRDGRIAALGTRLTPNIATEYGLEDPRGYQAMTFARLAETYPLWSVPQPVWSNRIDDLRAPFLSAMNVRYAIVPPTTALPDWQTLACFPHYNIVENTRALPRAFVPTVVHVGAAANAIAEMKAGTDFGREGWVESREQSAVRAYGPGRVFTRGEGGRLFLHADMDAPGWVVVSECAWKGWRVVVDGKRVRPVFADHAFIGVYLPQGQHDVAMTYRPASFVLGAIVTVTIAVALVIFRARS